VRTAFKTDTVGDYADLRVGEDKDFGNDYTDELNGEAISSSAWSATGLTVTKAAISSGIVSAFFAGAADGVTYWVDNTIVTAGTRTMKQSFRLVGKAR